MFTHGIRVWGVLTVVAVLLPAQTPPNAPAPPTPAELAARHVAMLTAVLSLTSTQQSTATALFTTEETSLAAIQTSIKQDESAVQTAVEANDTATIEADANAIGTLQGQAVLARAQADAAFYQSLTSDQQTKYKQLLQSGLLGGGGPGRGGPGHQGGGPPPAGVMQ